MVEGNTAASNAHKEKVGQVIFSLAPGSGVEILDLVVFPRPTLEEVFGVERQLQSYYSAIRSRPGSGY